ncbi:MAG: Uma2 family endonuclease [Gemmatimonadales bacterium]
MPATPQEVTTLEEFFALPEDRARRHELLDGTYVVTPSPSYRHQKAVMALYERLRAAVAARSDLTLLPLPGDIVLGPRSVVEPDLFLIPRPASSNVHWRDVTTPLLAVEVLSRGTAARDRGVKRQLYQKARVPEYWIVDLDSRLIERWRPEDERPEILRDKLVWQPPGSSEVAEIDLAKFFAEVSGP